MVVVQARPLRAGDQGVRGLEGLSVAAAPASLLKVPDTRFSFISSFLSGHTNNTAKAISGQQVRPHPYCQAG